MVSSTGQRIKASFSSANKTADSKPGYAQKVMFSLLRTIRCKFNLHGRPLSSRIEQCSGCAFPADTHGFQGLLDHKQMRFSGVSTSEPTMTGVHSVALGSNPSAPGIDRNRVRRLGCRKAQSSGSQYIRHPSLTHEMRQTMCHLDLGSIPDVQLPKREVCSLGFSILRGAEAHT